jgi:drug/metabolite transporter (DMT)-like permease
MLTAVVPAVSAAAAVVFLDEPLTGMLIAGLVCVTIGILVGVGHTGPAPAPRP